MYVEVSDNKSIRGRGFRNSLQGDKHENPRVSGYKNNEKQV